MLPYRVCGEFRYRQKPKIWTREPVGGKCRWDSLHDNEFCFADIVGTVNEEYCVGVKSRSTGCQEGDGRAVVLRS